MLQKKDHGIACLLINSAGQLLILKRSPAKKLFPGKWFVVGAYPLSEQENFRKFAEKEIGEELGISGKIVKEGKAYSKFLNGTETVVHPYLAEANSGKIKLNEEHTEFTWIDRQDLDKYDLVDGTKEMIRDLLE